MRHPTIEEMIIDTAEGAFFPRELEHLKAKVYERKYPAFKGRMLVPVSNEVPPGAQTVTYEESDEVGTAKISAPGAVDAPRVDVFGNQITRPVRLITDSYGWHITELWAAQMAGRPLNQKRANAARRAAELQIDNVAAEGAPDHGIATGFVNDANVTIDAATGLWNVQTPEVIVGDISASYIGMKTDTLGIEDPNTLVLPDEQYADIATRQRSTASDMTILAYILANFDWLKAVIPWYKMADAGAGGVDRAVLYNRSEDILQQEIPLEFMQLPVFQKGQNFTVECLAETAGTAIYYPGAVRYIDGI